MSPDKPFVSMDEIRERLAKTPAMPWGSTVQEINEESARRIVAIRKQLEKEKLQGNKEQSQEPPEEAPAELPLPVATEGLSYPDVEIPLSKGEPTPATAAEAEQPAQSNGNGSQKPNWNTTGYPPIAPHCGVSNEQARRIMRGYRNPSVATLRKMSSFFGMSMDEIDARLQQIKSESSPNQG